MKKNKLLRRISVGVAALALICTSAVATSFAKYQTTTTGSDSVQVAKWAFNVNDNESNATTFALDLVPAKYSNVALEKEGATTSKLAPGTTGSFAIEAKNNSEVDVTYTVNFKVTNKPANLKFYYDSSFNSEITGTTDFSYNFENDGIDANDGKLAMINGETVASESFTIYWKWEYSTDATGTTDNAESEKTMTVEVTIVGTQDEPKA